MSGRNDCVFGESVFCVDRVFLAFELDVSEYVGMLSVKGQKDL